MVWVRRMEIDYIRPAMGDQEITITSFVREFRGSDAFIECAMVDAEGKVLSRCVMTVAHVDKATNSGQRLAGRAHGVVLRGAHALTWQSPQAAEGRPPGRFLTDPITGGILATIE